MVYESFNYRAVNHLTYAFIFLAGIFFLIVLPFNYCCYNLHKAYKQNLQLSKRADTIGVILVVLYSLLSFVLLYSIYDIIKGLFSYRISGNISNRILHLLYIFYTATTVYLSVTYWSIKKQVDAKNKNLVSELGNDIKS
jgi:TRAP-type C4-dicarboxylate transport system permease small subunit